MKRIVNGVTYNTETSTAIGRWERPADDSDPVSRDDTLYQTRGGAFFLHKCTSWAVRDANGDWAERERNEFEPMTEAQAREWMLEGDVEVLSNTFETPPEATAEFAAAATIYLRVPESLKRRIEQAAGKANQSINVWAMRCLEQCASNS